MDKLSRYGWYKLIFFGSMLPIKIVSGKLNGVACSVLVNLVRICPNLGSNVTWVLIVPWNGANGDLFVEGDTSSRPVA
jgi:hypothetical protein